MISVVSEKQLEAQRLCYVEGALSSAPSAASVSQLAGFSKPLLKAIVSHTRFIPWGLGMGRRSRTLGGVSKILLQLFAVFVVHAAFARRINLFDVLN